MEQLACCWGNFERCQADARYGFRLYDVDPGARQVSTRCYRFGVASPGALSHAITFRAFRAFGIDQTTLPLNLARLLAQTEGTLFTISDESSKALTTNFVSKRQRREM